MAADQFARSSAKALRSRSARSDTVAQLLHLPSHGLFAESRFVEVRPPIDVAVPLRSDLLRGDFRIHHRKGCGYLTLEVNFAAIRCGAERDAQPVVLRSVDTRERERDDDRATVRPVVAGVAPLIPDSRSMHIRRDSFARSFLFRPRPTHHAAARGLARAAQPALPRRDLPGVDARPPRGVTVFAERWDESGAARPQKRRRHFPPSHRLWVRSSLPHVSTAHAPSRRLQRVSVSCTCVSRGQAPRRRPVGDTGQRTDARDQYGIATNSPDLVALDERGRAHAARSRAYTSAAPVSPQARSAPSGELKWPKTFCSSTC